MTSPSRTRPTTGKTQTLASYEWIDLADSEGYDRLHDVLDPEFDPKGIIESLKSQVTDAARGVLVEHGYVDKDYRSTFYNFYAKKGRRYRSDCVRLHFFNGAVWYDEARTDIACADGRPQDHYFGYIVLRPTIVATLGRSVLSPNIRLGATGRAIQSVHHVNLLGHRLPIWGFPSMAQHVDIAVCAHVSCWAILRYYSETFAHHREYLVHDITKLAAPFDPGGLVPSLGFNVLGAERVFRRRAVSPCLWASAIPRPKRRSFRSCSPISRADSRCSSQCPARSMPWSSSDTVGASQPRRRGRLHPTCGRRCKRFSPSTTICFPMARFRLTRPVPQPPRRLYGEVLRSLHRRAAGQDLLSRRCDRGVQPTGREMVGRLQGPRRRASSVAALLHHDHLKASRVRPGQPYASGRHPRGADDAPRDGAVRVGRRVLQRGAMERGTRCRQSHRRCDSEPEGPSADMAAA